MNNLEIRVRIGYDDVASIDIDENLNFENEWDILSNYPVTIELVKCEGDRYEDDDYKEEVVGILEGLYFDIAYMMNENVSFFDVFDDHDQSVHELYNVLFDGDEYKGEYEFLTPNLFYLTNININNEYQSYKEKLLDKLDKILNYIGKLNVGLIATEAYFVAESVDEEVSDEAKNDAKELLNDTGYVIADDDNEEYWVKEVF